MEGGVRSECGFGREGAWEALRQHDQTMPTLDVEVGQVENFNGVESFLKVSGSLVDIIQGRQGEGPCGRVFFGVALEKRHKHRHGHGTYGSGSWNREGRVWVGHWGTGVGTYRTLLWKPPKELQELLAVLPLPVDQTVIIRPI